MYELDKAMIISASMAHDDIDDSGSNMQETQNHEWDAREYAAHSATQQALARELIHKLNLRGNESLLDIGCGDGKVTAEISTRLRNGNVLGIDSSADMVSHADSNYPVTKYSNLKFLKVDARKLSFYCKYDVVFSNAALHWIIDHMPVLKGIYSALKPHGKTFVQTGGKGNASEVIKVAKRIVQEKRWNRYFKGFAFPYGFYGPEEYAPWLEEAGFNIVHIELVHKDRIHENKTEFKGWIRTTWLPYIHRIPAGIREDFINHLSSEYLESFPPAQDDTIHTSMKVLQFEATKP
ncbi:MAG: methyltransferase domain-containing protein [Deltaproteobacteria bacterium]|nr:methyltransferase domain-containing protein [Deltaproteobacteria bacterium]